MNRVHDDTVTILQVVYAALHGVKPPSDLMATRVVQLAWELWQRDTARGAIIEDVFQALHGVEPHGDPEKLINVVRDAWLLWTERDALRTAQPGEHLPLLRGMLKMSPVNPWHHGWNSSLHAVARALLSLRSDQESPL